METVVAIKDIKSVENMKEILRQKSRRDFLLFVFGINTGIRIVDLLHLKVKDVWDGKEVNEFVFIAESGKHKAQTMFINKNVKEAIHIYLLNENLDPDHYLFKSKKDNKPITRQQAYRIINQAAKDAGLTGKIGTHTIRKTFGYHAYRKGIAISILKNIYGHSSSSDTMKYIGIEKTSEHPIKIDVNL